MTESAGLGGASKSLPSRKSTEYAQSLAERSSSLFFFRALLRLALFALIAFIVVALVVFILIVLTIFFAVLELLLAVFVIELTLARHILLRRNSLPL